MEPPREVGTHGGKWRKCSQPREVGEPTREVKTHSIVLRAGLLSAKAHDEYLVGVSESDWLELVAGCRFC